MQSVSIVGIGRLGGALALALSRSGFLVKNLVFRNSETITRIAGAFSVAPDLLAAKDLVNLETDIIFITTADPDIGLVVAELLKLTRGRPFVFHTSGSLSSDILGELRDIGCKTGSIHPLVSLSDPIRGAESFAGTYFCVEGGVEAVIAAEKIVRSLGGIPFTVETRLKPLYHAAAVMASGHIVALFDAASEVASASGIENPAEILLPLVRSTIANLETQKPEQALTGTFARSDVGAFRSHHGLLKENVSDNAIDIYLDLASRSLALAERKGADAEDIASIREGISIAKKKFG